jgi:hypothetical protein
MTEDADIIDFEAYRSEGKAKRKFRVEGLDKAPACAHRNTKLDARLRKLVCKDCGTIIEPFDWLLVLARKHERLDQTYKDLKERADREERRRAKVHNEVAKLERVRDGLKAEIAEQSRQLRFEFGLPEEQIRKIKEMLK